MTDEEKKREYTMSEAALAQRREASKAGAAAATGPRTEEGKARSSRNRYIHGMYSQANEQGLSWLELSAVKSFGRPCKSTCRKYPCSLVSEGITSPGGDCLDKTIYVEAFNALISSMQDGDLADHDQAKAMLAGQMAGAVEILQQIREELAENGLVTIVPYVTKEGDLIYDKEGKMAGKPVANPVLPHFVKLLDSIGLNLPELMATPKALEGAKRAEEGEDVMRQFLEGISRAGGGERPPRVFDDAEYSEVSDGEE